LKESKITHATYTHMLIHLTKVYCPQEQYSTFPQMVVFMTWSNHYIGAANLNIMFLTLYVVWEVWGGVKRICICVNSKRADVEISFSI